MRLVIPNCKGDSRDICFNTEVYSSTFGTPISPAVHDLNIIQNNCRRIPIEPFINPTKVFAKGETQEECEIVFVSLLSACEKTRTKSRPQEWSPPPSLYSAKSRSCRMNFFICPGQSDGLHRTPRLAFLAQMTFSNPASPHAKLHNVTGDCNLLRDALCHTRHM